MEVRYAVGKELLASTHFLKRHLCTFRLVLSEMAFYEKVIKVKADVAAYLN
jgi:hypothetical protein